MNCLYTKDVKLGGVPSSMDGYFYIMVSDDDLDEKLKKGWAFYDDVKEPKKTAAKKDK